MNYDYMGYGDIFGGLFKNNIINDNGLSFGLFFEDDVDHIIKSLNLSVVKSKVRKLIPKEIEEQNHKICLNC
jgi:hypothetical protein